MVRRLVVFAVLAALVAVPGCFWAGGDGPSVITGYVYDDATGVGIAGAEVVLTPTSTTVKTGADGAYRFQDIPRGKYTVRAEAPGYQRAEKRGVGASPGKTRWAKLFLKRVVETDKD